MGSSKIMSSSLDDSVFDGVAREESVQEVLTKMGQGVTANVVKSIQKGVVDFNSRDDVTITINPVNPDKCFVLLNSKLTGRGGNGNGTIYDSYLKSITANGFTITSNYDANGLNGSTSYQVVEFY